LSESEKFRRHSCSKLPPSDRSNATGSADGHTGEILYELRKGRSIAGLDLLIGHHADCHARGHRQGRVGDRRRHADRLLNIRGDHSEQNALVLAVKAHADRRTKRQQLTQDRELIVPVWKRRKADATRVVCNNIDAASGARNGQCWLPRFYDQLLRCPE
jgi:hypothetical protein